MIQAEPDASQQWVKQAYTVAVSDLNACRRRLEAIQQLLAMRDEELRKLRAGSTRPHHASSPSTPAQLSSETEAEQRLQKGTVKQNSVILRMLLVLCVLLLLLMPIVSASVRYCPCG